MVSVTQKSKNSFLKEKNLTLKTINIFKKVHKSDKKATKKRQIVAFSNYFCSFLSPPKKGDKKRQKRQFVAFSLCRCPPQIFTCLENLKSCSKVLELTGSAHYFIPISQKVDF